MAPSSISNLLEGPTVKVEVGSLKRCWHLHKSLLCHCSPFFEKAFQGNFKEASEGFMELPDDDGAAFALFVQWLYQGSIEGTPDGTKADQWKYAQRYFELYVLADKLMIPALKNMAIDHYRRTCRKSQQGPGPSHLTAIYTRTEQSSPFRRLACELTARVFMRPGTCRGAVIYRPVIEAEPDFAVDMLDYIREHMGRKVLPYPFSADDSLYHDQEDEERCMQPTNTTPDV
ncbi:MAG: hypothetical protein M1837_005365 [Sclerophora amabilis]|nr:MAG: hypothetical protein M1837_005365 [Sclerophora amabilis]